MLTNPDHTLLQEQIKTLQNQTEELRGMVKNLQKENSDYRQIIENSRSAIIKILFDEKIEYMNPLARKYFGAPERQQTLGKALAAILNLSPDQQLSSAELIQQIKHRKLLLHNHEKIIRLADGKIAWMSWTNRLLYDDHNKPKGLIAIGAEITKRKLAEEALRESEFNLTKAQEIAKIGSWAREIDSDYIHCSEYFFKIFGIETSTSYSVLLRLMNRMIFPEYRDYISQKINRAAQKGSTESFTYRILHPSGEMRWIMEEVSLLGDIDKKKQILIGTIRDITEEKKQEDKLREYMLIVSSSSELMSLIDKDYHYVNVNQAYLDAYQKKAAEIEGKTIAEVFGQETFEASIKPNIDRCLLGEHLIDQYWFTFPDKRRCFMDVTYNPVLEVDGTISGVTVSARDITDLKKTEEQLRIFKLFAEESGVGFGMADLNGNITYVNNRLCSMAGFDEPCAVVGKSIYQTYLQNYEQQINNEILPAINKQGQWTGEIDLMRSDGTIIHTIENFFVIRNVDDEPVAYAITVTDITDRKQTEEALQRSESNFRMIFSNAAIGIDVVDDSGKILQINNALVQMFGYSREELLEMNIFDVTYPDDRIKSEQSLANISESSSQTYRIEKRYVRKNGEVFWADLSVTQFNDIGSNRKLVIGTIIDISHSRTLQEELRHSREEAIEANKAKSEFLANMSHEIRTPLNAVIGFTELLETLVTDRRQVNYLESIKTGGKNLLLLINDILDLSKIEAGKLEFVYEPVNPYTLIDEIRQIFSLKIEEKDLDFLVEVADDIPASLILDEVRVRQVIFNLIGNAIKFTERGFVKFVVKKMTSEKDNSRIDLIVAVEDTGIGIPCEQQEQIFDAFRQQSGQNTRKYGGTGLGLSISKRLVEMMGGTISLKSTAGSGSIFSFVLREVPVGATIDANAAAEGPDISTIVFEPARMLIVDDVESNRRIIAENFASPNISIVEAEDGHKAVLLASQFMPDVIFMDIRMPVMDGFEAARMIKTKRKTKNIPIIALTASLRNDDEDENYEKYFDGYLRKPVTRRELYQELMRFLKYTVVAPPPLASPKIDLIIKMEALPELTAGQRSELKALVADVLYEKWNQAMTYQMSDEIEALAGMVLQTGTDFNLPAFTLLGDRLTEAIDRFDLDEMEKYLKKVPELLQSTKKMLLEIE
ncbi:MAG: PAS domain S-box protein [Clostridia bacterium]|nr:PAS domain S-box protein [Clostridia bacterium]